MSTPQSIPQVNPRLRIGLGTVLTTLGVLIAIAVTVLFLARTGANHPTVATPVAAFQAAADATPQVHYLGPQQLRAAALNAHRGGTDPHRGRRRHHIAGGGDPPARHYTCLGNAQLAKSCVQ